MARRAISAVGVVAVAILVASGGHTYGVDAEARAAVASKAWHVSLYSDLRKALDRVPISWSENSPLWGQRGTPNYRMMFIGAHYLHAVRFGTQAQKQRARARTLEILRFQEVDYGHMTVSQHGNEQFVVDPHTNFWIASMVALTWGAWEAGDAQVIGACSRWWAVHLFWLRKGWVGAVRLPGTRVKSEVPIWDVDTKVYKLANRIHFRIGAGESGGIIYMKQMMAAHPGCIPAPAEYRPGKLVMPIFVEHSAGAVVAWMSRPDELPLTPVDWVRSTGPGRNEFTFGRNWETPVPR